VFENLSANTFWHTIITSIFLCCIYCHLWKIKR